MSPPTRGPAEVLYSQLAVDNRRYLGNKEYSGLYAGLLGRAISAPSPFSDGGQGTGGDLGRDSETGGERIGQKGFPPRGPVPEPDLHSQIQDGGDGNAQEHTAERGLDGMYRSKGRLPFCPGQDGRQEVSEIPVEGGNLRVPIASFRIEQCTPSLHEDSQASDGSPEEEWHEGHSVPGRHAASIPVRIAADESDAGCHSPSAVVGIHHQLGQISPLPHDKPGLPGFSDQYAGHANQCPAGEAIQTGSRMQPGVETGGHLHTGAESPHRYDVGYLTCNTSSPTMLPEHPENQEPKFLLRPGLLHQGDTRLGCETGIAVVEGPNPAMERQTSNSTSTRYGHRHRCLAVGLGSCVGPHKHWWYVVRGGEESSHKPSGVNGWGIRSEDICPGQESREVACEAENGQQDGSSICQSDGGHPLSRPILCSMSSVAMVSATQHLSHSRVPSRGEQHRSRQGVPSTAVICRMDAKPRGVHTHNAHTGMVSDRPLRQQAKSPASEVCCLETRPLFSGDGCPQDESARSTRVCVSPVCSDKQVPAEDRTGEVHHTAGSSNLDHSTMVSSPARDGDSRPITTPTERGPVNGPLQQVPSNSGPTVSWSQATVQKPRPIREVY